MRRQNILTLFFLISLVLVVSNAFLRLGRFVDDPPIINVPPLEEHNNDAPDDDADGDPRPRNLHLAFIGDSVTRYQYISLAYFIKTGTWLQEPNATVDDPSTNLLYGGMSTKVVSSWNQFLEYSNSVLQPEEQCDCHRHRKGSYHDINENRYLVEPTRNNSVSYIAKFGSAAAHGHWRAPIDRHLQINVTGYNLPYEWDGYNWADIVVKHLALLDPKPTFVVFNAGLHAHDLTKRAVQQSLREAFQATNITGIYKTTTKTQQLNRKARFQRGRHDRALCGGRVFANCLNLDWTGDLVGPQFYYDDPHLKTDANNRMNQQLLDYLRDFRGGVSKMD